MSEVKVLVEVIAGPKVVATVDASAPIEDTAQRLAEVLERPLQDDEGKPLAWKLYAPGARGNIAPLKPGSTLEQARTWAESVTTAGQTGGFAGAGEHEGEHYTFRVRFFVPKPRKPRAPIAKPPPIEDEEALDLTNIEEVENALESVRRRPEAPKKRRRRKKTDGDDASASASGEIKPRRRRRKKKDGETTADVTDAVAEVEAEAAAQKAAADATPPEPEAPEAPAAPRARGEAPKEDTGAVAAAEAAAAEAAAKAEALAAAAARARAEAEAAEKARAEAEAAEKARAEAAAAEKARAEAEAAEKARAEAAEKAKAEAAAAEKAKAEAAAAEKAKAEAAARARAEAEAKAEADAAKAKAEAEAKKSTSTTRDRVATPPLAGKTPAPGQSPVTGKPKEPPAPTKLVDKVPEGARASRSGAREDTGSARPPKKSKKSGGNGGLYAAVGVLVVVIAGFVGVMATRGGGDDAGGGSPSAGGSAQTPVAPSSGALTLGTLDFGEGSDGDTVSKALAGYRSLDLNQPGDAAPDEVRANLSTLGSVLDKECAGGARFDACYLNARVAYATWAGCEAAEGCDGGSSGRAFGASIDATAAALTALPNLDEAARGRAVPLLAAQAIRLGAVNQKTVAAKAPKIAELGEASCKKLGGRTPDCQALQKTR